jgi:hypothetical protein
MRRTRIPGLLKEAFKGNYESPPAGEAAAALTTIDLSGGTSTDPNNVLDAASSLGTTSTLIADQNQGTFSARTCFRSLTSIGAIPSDSEILHLVLEVGTFPTGDPGSGAGHCSMEWIVYHTNGATLTANEGYHGGYTQTALVAFKGRSIQRFGANGSNRITQVGTPTVCHAFLFFEGTVLSNACQTINATDSGFQDDYLSDNAGDDYDEVFIGVGLAQQASSPANKITFGNVTLKYEWVDR